MKIKNTVSSVGINKKEMNLDLMNLSLEQQSWFFQDGFLDADLCDRICRTYIDALNPECFIEAEVGKGLRKTQNKKIRKSSIRWITDWEENSSLNELNDIFSQILKSTKEYFRIPLKRFESQVAVYNKGGFYRTHLDQHPKTRHRQLSCCLYLNDCEAGGELVLFKKGSKTEVEQIVRPKKGTIALFLSADIFHEVRMVNQPRYSVTTWFRDDEIEPFI